MKAQVVHEFGDYRNLSYEEVDDPARGPARS